MDMNRWFLGFVGFSYTAKFSRNPEKSMFISSTGGAGYYNFPHRKENCELSTAFPTYFAFGKAQENSRSLYDKFTNSPQITSGTMEENLELMPNSSQTFMCFFFFNYSRLVRIMSFPVKLSAESLSAAEYRWRFCYVRNVSCFVIIYFTSLRVAKFLKRIDAIAKFSWNDSSLAFIATCINICTVITLWQYSGGILHMPEKQLKNLKFSLSKLQRKSIALLRIFIN